MIDFQAIPPNPSNYSWETNHMDHVKAYQAKGKNRETIIDTIQSMFLKEQEIVFAFLYGSFCSEQFFRDIDVAVFVEDFDSSLYLDYETNVSQRLEKVLLPYPVEVKILNEAPLSFCFSAIRGEFLFARDEDALVSFMTNTARAYLDFAPLRHRYMREAMA